MKDQVSLHRDTLLSLDKNALISIIEVLSEKSNTVDHVVEQSSTRPVDKAEASRLHAKVGVLKNIFTVSHSTKEIASEIFDREIDSFTNLTREEADAIHSLLKSHN